MLLLSLLADDRAAINPDFVVPVLVAGALVSGGAYVVTNDVMETNQTLPNDTQAVEADDELRSDLSNVSPETNRSIEPDANASVNATLNGTANASANASANTSANVTANRTANATADVERNLTAPNASVVGFEERWRTLNRTTLGGLEVTDAAASPDGERLYVIGDGRATPETDGFANRTSVTFVAAFSADDGRVLWTTRTAGPAGDGAIFKAVDVGFDGMVVAAGLTRDDGASEIFLQGLDGTSGEPVWSGTHRPGGSARANDLSITPDGQRAVVTGEGHDGHLTGVFDLTDDEHPFEWANVAGRTSTYHRSIGEAVALSPDGEGIYATGRYWDANMETAPHLGTLSYKIDGDAPWLSKYDSPTGGSDRGYAVAVGPAGERVAVAGGSWAKGTHTDIATVVYDADSGAQLWAARYDGADNGRDVPNSITFGPDGATVFVTGESNEDETHEDMTTIAYAAANGTQLWRDSYDGSAHDGDEGVDLVLGPLGRILYVTGFSQGEPGGLDGDLTTVAYEAATGVKLDEARLDTSETNSTHERPAAIALVDEGTRVLVAGSSMELGQEMSILAAGYDVGVER